MLISHVRRTAALAALMLVWSLAWGATQASAQVTMDQPANYYVDSPDGAGAAMYPCPRPVPPWVGGTNITYQALAPHEFLYHHSRTYVTYHDDARPTRTTVHWGGTGFAAGAKNFLIGPNYQHYRQRISGLTLNNRPN